MKTCSSESLCGLFLWIWISGTPSLCFPFSTLLGGSRSFKQWPLLQFWVAIFSHPAEFVSPVLRVSWNQAQEGPASGVRCARHLCGILQTPPLELSKCILVCIPGGHCREGRNTAAQTQPTLVRYIEKIFLSYLWSILIATACKSSSQIHIISSNVDGKGDRFYAYTKARINLGQCVNSDWVVLGKNQDWLTHQSNPLIRMNWTLIYFLAMNK